MHKYTPKVTTACYSFCMKFKWKKSIYWCPLHTKCNRVRYRSSRFKKIGTKISNEIMKMKVAVFQLKIVPGQNLNSSDLAKNGLDGLIFECMNDRAESQGKTIEWDQSYDFFHQVKNNLDNGSRKGE